MKTHCSRDHEFVEGSYYEHVDKKGYTARHCKECMKLRTKKYRELNTEKDIQYHKDQHRLREFKLTPEAFEIKLKDQNNCCAICREVFHKTPSVDHDHSCCPSTKKTCGECVRSLLCNTCNRGLGYFGDDPKKLKAASDYIEHWRKVHEDRGASFVSGEAQAGRELCIQGLELGDDRRQSSNQLYATVGGQSS